MEKINSCPEFPFFGASYPDATCINGYLHDLDHCDINGNLYQMSERIPCPFCNKEEFIESFDEETYNDIIQRYGTV